MPPPTGHDYDYAERKVLKVTVGYPEIELLSDDAKFVFDLWLAAKGDSKLPLQRHFHIDEFPPKVVPWTIVYDVVGEGSDFFYRFFGTQRVNAHNKDYTGLHVSNMDPQQIREKIMDELREVCMSAEPIQITTTARVYDEEFQYRMLRMPLSEDGSTVTRIIAITFDGTGPELDTNLMRRWHQR